MPGSLSNLLKFSQLVTAGPGLKLSLAWETKLTITLHFLSFGRNVAKILTSLQLCYQVVQNSKAILSCGDWVLSWASSLSTGLAKKLVWCEKFKQTFWPTQHYWPLWPIYFLHEFQNHKISMKMMYLTLGEKAQAWVQALKVMKRILPSHFNFLKKKWMLSRKTSLSLTFGRVKLVWNKGPDSKRLSSLLTASY